MSVVSWYCIRNRYYYFSTFIVTCNNVESGNAWMDWEMGDSTTQKILKEKTSSRHLPEDNMANKNRQESSSGTGKDKESPKKTNTRPKPVFFWTNADVLKWLRRHCQDYHTFYATSFLEHDITGRSLVRMNDTTLEKLGVVDETHRDELCREIWKLKLKSDILEMKDLERKGECL